MNEETRGIIEKGLDRMISETDMVDKVRWVLREFTVHSQEDFALGYLIGFLTRYAYGEAWKMKLFKKLDERLERMKEPAMEIEERRETPKHMRVYLTKKEDTEVRNMLRKRLVEIRRKVSRDFHR